MKAIMAKVDNDATSQPLFLMPNNPAGRHDLQQQHDRHDQAAAKQQSAPEQDGPGVIGDVAAVKNGATCSRRTAAATGRGLCAETLLGARLRQAGSTRTGVEAAAEQLPDGRCSGIVRGGITAPGNVLIGALPNQPSLRPLEAALRRREHRRSRTGRRSARIAHRANRRNRDIRIVAQQRYSPGPSAHHRRAVRRTTSRTEGGIPASTTA